MGPVQQGVVDRQRDAVLQADLGLDLVDQPVDPRDAVDVRAADTAEPEDGALHRHGGVRAGERDDRLARLLGERASPAHDRRIKA